MRAEGQADQVRLAPRAAGNYLLHHFAKVLVIVAFAAGTVLTSCGDKGPSLPTNQAESYEQLTGDDSAAVLDQITTFSWADGGASAGETFAWISRDATSANTDVATRAGEAAHGIATYLADQQSTADAERNPKLTQTYAEALAPFQGAMIGDVSRTRGFTPMVTGSGDFVPVRRVFSWIGTDQDAASLFVESAYRTIDAYTRSFAEAAENQPTEPSDDLKLAAHLAGVVYGGLNGESAVPIRNSTQAVTNAAYTISSVLRPEPGIIGLEFFAGGALVPPNDVPDDQLVRYSSQLRQYLNHDLVVGYALNDFAVQFNAAAGNK